MLILPHATDVSTENIVAYLLRVLLERSTLSARQVSDMSASFLVRITHHGNPDP